MPKEQSGDLSLMDQILQGMLDTLAEADEFGDASLRAIQELCECGDLAKPDLVKQAVLVMAEEQA